MEQACKDAELNLFLLALFFIKYRASFINTQMAKRYFWIIAIFISILGISDYFTDCALFLDSKTAVKLKEIDNDPQSSYINANYIRVSF